VNMLGKYSQTADKRWTSETGGGLCLQPLIIKNWHVTKCHKGPLSWTNSLA
jgi:hypothetical protein